MKLAAAAFLPAVAAVLAVAAFLLLQEFLLSICVCPYIILAT
jgi:hypothetical protein